MPNSSVHQSIISRSLTTAFFVEDHEKTTITAGYNLYKDKAIPCHVATEKLVNYIKNLPKSITHIKLKNLGLVDDDYVSRGRPTAEIIKILSAIPPHITHLTLSSPVALRSNFEKFIDAGKMLVEIGTFSLFTWPSKHTQIFEAIPKTIKHLSLSKSATSDEYIWDKGYRFNTKGDLGPAISRLPRELVYLHIKGVDLFSQKQLTQVMEELPPNIRTLDFSSRNDWSFCPEKFFILINKLPANIEELDLSHCLYPFTPGRDGLQMKDCFPNLPRSLRKLNLSNNHLLRNQGFPDVISLLAAIPHWVDEVYINDVCIDKAFQNGEQNRFTQLMQMLPELDKIPNARQRIKLPPKLQEYWQSLPLLKSVEPSEPKRTRAPQTNLNPSGLKAGFVLKCLAGIAIDAALLLLIGFLVSPAAAGCALVIAASVLTYRFFSGQGKKDLQQNTPERLFSPAI